MTDQFVYNVYCETIKTCPWKRLRVEDKDEALDFGRDHAKDSHPAQDEWRVRVKTIRVGGKKRPSALEQELMK